MKIYTRKGDEGMTGLVTGERVLKHDIRVEMYGASDELNSFIGYAISAQNTAEFAELNEHLRLQQNLLFELGSELAGFTIEPGRSVIFEEDVEDLERLIDLYSEQLEPMKSFILPGGLPGAGMLHVCRTVCRRMERLMTASMDGKDEDEEAVVQPMALKYVNRLSDYLFAAARYANHLGGVSDIKWTSRGKKIKKEK